MIGYTCGAYDILRAKDLEGLDRRIQLAKSKGSEYFAIGLYEESVCEELGVGTPLKGTEDRMKIVEQLRGVDFVVRISSLNKQEVEEAIKQGFTEFQEAKKAEVEETKKKYDIGYAPGTYDLFHLGHLENLMIAAQQSKRLIVGVKADELVQEHKGKTPNINANERAEILRHFRFVDDVYKYYTRDLENANAWIKSKYGKDVDAIFLGSDLEADFKDTKGLNIVFTPRTPEMMAKRSTSAYSKVLKLNQEKGKRYTRDISKLGTISLKQEERD